MKRAEISLLDKLWPETDGGRDSAAAICPKGRNVSTLTEILCCQMPSNLKKTRFPADLKTPSHTQAPTRHLAGPLTCQRADDVGLQCCWHRFDQDDLQLCIAGEGRNSVFYVLRVKKCHISGDFVQMFSWVLA